MAIIKCPECNHEISDTVKKCPHCGYDVKKHIHSNDKNKLRMLLIGIVASIAMLVVIIFLIPKHKWKEADCINSKICEECGKTKGKPLGHDFSEATCTEPQICKRCGKKQGEKLGHTYGDYEIKKVATCSEQGEKSAICLVCGYVNEEKIPKLAHTPEEWIIVEEPTFAKDGKQVRYCAVCNAEIEKKEISLPKEEKETLYKQECETFLYDDYVRNPEAVKGSFCKSYGEVEQVIIGEDGKTLDIRLNITKTGNERVVFWVDDIWVVYTKSENESNVVEGDMITIYGIANGIYSYETVTGGTRTVPLVNASYIEMGNDNTEPQQNSVQSSVSQQSVINNESDSSGFGFSTNVFCQEEQGLYVEFVGVDDPAGSLQPGYIGVNFLITNNNNSPVTLLMRGFTINDCSFETSAGAAQIAAGAKSFLQCDVKKDELADYGITSIDKVSGYLWVSDIGYTNTFTINTK